MPPDAKAPLSAGAVDAWCSWGVYVAQTRLGGRRAHDPRATARLLPPAGRRSVLGHPDDYARVLAAEVDMTEPVARLITKTEAARPVPVDGTVVANEHRTVDRYLAAKVIHEHVNTGRVSPASFN